VIDASLKDQLLEEIERLSPGQIARVYQYTHSLVKPALPRGATVEQLVSLAGSIDDESAREITAAIESPLGIGNMDAGFEVERIETPKR
jgi:hypothetical protein